MSNKPDSHNFDWVSARDTCSLPKEFHRLRELVQENCKVRNRCRQDNDPCEYTFRENNSDSFSVKKEEPSLEIVAVGFSLRNNCILIVGSDTEPFWEMKLTLTLSDEGLCRFKLNGGGEYMRWQVARRALGPLFFDEPRAMSDPQ